jgi:hypothetical protein
MDKAHVTMEALRAAIACNNVHVFYEFVATKSAPVFDAGQQKQLLKVAAAAGCEDLVAEVMDYLSVSEDVLREFARENLPALAECGMKSMCIWLTQLAHVGPADVRHDHNAALRGAVAGGYFETVRWLIVTFGLTADDVRDAGAYNVAAEHGNTEVFTWLVGQFGWGPVTREVATHMRKRAGQNDWHDLCRVLDLAIKVGTADAVSN